MTPLATALIAVAGIVVSATAGRAASAPSCPSTGLNGVTFVTATTGWGVGTCHGRRTIVRTVDAGRTWTSAGPVTPRTGWTGTDFLDARHAWAFGRGTGTRDLVARTDDAGKTWRTAGVRVAAPGGMVPYFLQVVFRTAREGWLDTIDAGMHERIAALYTTRDGGATWSERSTGLPVSGVLGFATESVGYGVDVEGGGGSPRVYRTADAGRSWRLFPLPLPALYHHVRVVVSFSTIQIRGHSLTLPVLVLPLDLGSHASLVVYTSTDSGLHWRAGAVLDLHSPAADCAVSFANTTDGMAITLRGLYRTTDAGVSWKRVPTRSRFHPNVVLDFVTARDGYVLASNGSRRTLQRTTDAGMTWAPVNPHP